MSREDLLALTPDSIAALTNRGLVNRAEREIAAGDAPALDEDATGVVTGQFKDGVVATLLPGVSLRESTCSCGAIAACRHRVAVALCYAKWASATPIHASWSPGEITDTELENALGRRGLERARLAQRTSLLVEVRRGAPLSGVASSSPVHSARLPTSTVHFFVPRDLKYAQCDCAGAAPCEHIALAVWAFRKADKRDVDASIVTVELGGSAANAPDVRPLEDALALGRHVLLEGIAGVPSGSLGSRFSRVRSSLLAAGFVWPAEIIDDIEIALGAYQERSARYNSAAAAGLITELAARIRAATRTSSEADEPQPARLVLGSDEAKQTPIDHIHLISIGARVEAYGRTRIADIYLADPASGTVLVYTNEWSFAPEETLEEGPDLAERRLIRGVSFGAFATGQLVSRDIVRLANRAIRFRGLRGQGNESFVTPQNGALGGLPEPLLVGNISLLEALQRDLPPRFLRPRVRTEAIRVIRVGSVSNVVYRPSEQELLAEIQGADGGSITLSRSHRRSAPHAIDAIAQAVASPLALRYVSGFVSRSRSGTGLMIDPILLVTDRVIVPDIEPAPPFPTHLPNADDSRKPVSPLADALDLSASCLIEACHLGLLHVGTSSSINSTKGSPVGWESRVLGAESALEQAGLRGLATRLRALQSRVQQVTRERETSNEHCGSPLDLPSAALATEAWMTASIRLSLAFEAI